MSLRILSKSIHDNVFGFITDPAKDRMVSDPMKLVLTDDINQDRLNWLVERVDEMFSEEDDDENDTFNHKMPTRPSHADPWQLT